MSGIPRVWCEACGAELRPHEILLGTCPYCREPITHVAVDRRVAREIDRGLVIDAVEVQSVDLAIAKNAQTTENHRVART